MSIKIECVHCYECFEPQEIMVSTESIPTDLNCEELIDFAEESGVRFDCESCGEVMYLSDCEIF